MRWIVPPVEYPARRARLNVSATTPWAANAASPWISTGTAVAGSTGGGVAPPCRSVCSARARPSTTGFTASRWLGLGDSDTLTDLPLDVW